jgi:hypothetical protein
MAKGSCKKSHGGADGGGGGDGDGGGDGSGGEEEKKHWELVEAATLVTAALPLLVHRFEEVCLSVCLSVYLSACLSVYPSG